MATATIMPTAKKKTSKTKPNGPCPCGSNIKYKRCCMRSDQQQQQQQQQGRLCPIISTASSNTGKMLGGFINVMVRDPSSWCFHGSTVEDFSRADYRKVIDEFIVVMNSCPSSEVESSRTKFDEGHKEIIVQPKFATFIFALYTSIYLHCDTIEDSMNTPTLRAPSNRDCTFGDIPTVVCLAFQWDLQELLQLGIRSRYMMRPRSIGKEVDIEQAYKYIRDVHTGNDDDRGTINCLYRETKQHCTCMKLKRAEAKEMIKMECCQGCRNNFPKTTMKKCKGCYLVVYCSNACYKNNWHEHKDSCEKFQRYQQKKVAGVATGKKKSNNQWICDYCKVASISSYEEACAHEEIGKKSADLTNTGSSGSGGGNIKTTTKLNTM